MADETMINGELSGHREVEISGDNSAKISGLTLKVSDLEQENDKINEQNKEYKQQIEELEDSVKVLSNENDEFEKHVHEVETENKALGAVVARAAELEADVSRLQHDLVSTMSDLQETTTELSDMNSEMVGIKQREEEKDVKLEAIEKGRNLLVSKVENLEGVESSMRNELEGKEREIGDLKKRVEESETMVGSSKNLEKLKNYLEKTVEKMKVEISLLQSCLDEKEKMIIAYEVKERAVVDAGNGGIERDGGVRVGKNGFFGDSSQKDWLLVAGSTFSAIVVVGVACYIQHISRK
ncbi:peroxisomal and mitochondrial division factor 2-like [Primulina huaijiensis]|uniref:peroxisomal and mitochondrial division factor 2-like n=1 Tax=Primulina huaijiensis TaxID=1492673 RepID=UPI003CC76A70